MTSLNKPNKKFDIVLLTEKRYELPNSDSIYISNIFEEDRLLTEALETRGLRVIRRAWDDAKINWSDVAYALFRTTWDYFDRFDEFRLWLDNAATQTEFINPLPMVIWNLDKHYLKDLNEKGIAIPPTIFIELGAQISLTETARNTGWKRFILKPAISGAARDTYLFDSKGFTEHEPIFQNLIQTKSMLLQEFQEKIQTWGEISLMVFNGRFSHSILKQAKAGDFRVQDDFGGTVHPYLASKDEIDFAEKCVALCNPSPVYARVDLIWNNTGALVLNELELVEPELWMRNYPDSAEYFAQAIENRYFSI